MSNWNLLKKHSNEERILCGLLVCENLSHTHMHRCMHVCDAIHTSVTVGSQLWDYRLRLWCTSKQSNVAPMTGRMTKGCKLIWMCEEEKKAKGGNRLSVFWQPLLGRDKKCLQRNSAEHLQHENYFISLYERIWSAANLTTMQTIEMSSSEFSNRAK